MAAAGYIAGYNSNYSSFSPKVVYNNNRPLSLNDSQYQIPQAAYNQKNLKLNRVRNGTIDYTKDNVASYDEKYEIYNNKDYDRARAATQSFFEVNDITRIFFSNKNMQRIQRKIRVVNDFCRLPLSRLTCLEGFSFLIAIYHEVPYKHPQCHQLPFWLPKHF